MWWVTSEERWLLSIEYIHIHEAWNSAICDELKFNYSLNGYAAWQNDSEFICFVASAESVHSQAIKNINNLYIIEKTISNGEISPWASPHFSLVLFFPFNSTYKSLLTRYVAHNNKLDPLLIISCANIVIVSKGRISSTSYRYFIFEEPTVDDREIRESNTFFVQDRKFPNRKACISVPINHYKRIFDKNSLGGWEYTKIQNSCLHLKFQRHSFSMFKYVNCNLLPLVVLIVIVVVVSCD